MENQIDTTIDATEQVLVSIDEALKMLYNNQVSRSTFMKQIQRERWPVFPVCSRKFIPLRYIQGKIDEINQMAADALSGKGATAS